MVRLPLQNLIFFSSKERAADGGMKAVDFEDADTTVHAKYAVILVNYPEICRFVPYHLQHFLKSCILLIERYQGLQRHMFSTHCSGTKMRELLRDEVICRYQVNEILSKNKG